MHENDTPHLWQINHHSNDNNNIIMIVMTTTVTAMTTMMAWSTCHQHATQRSLSGINMQAIHVVGPPPETGHDRATKGWPYTVATHNPLLL